MKVSGAVAMADDPEHAFGIYFEKIAPSLMSSLPSGGSAPAVTMGWAGGVKFDAQEEKPQFNPDKPQRRWVWNIDAAMRYEITLDKPPLCDRQRGALVSLHIDCDENADRGALFDLTGGDIDWLLDRLTAIKASLAP